MSRKTLPLVAAAAALLALKGLGTIATACESNDSGGFAFAFDVSSTAVAAHALN